MGAVCTVTCGTPCGLIVGGNCFIRIQEIQKALQGCNEKKNILPADLGGALLCFLTLLELMGQVLEM